MTELLNETNQIQMSPENQKIFNAKFTQLFAQKLEKEVKEDIQNLNKKGYEGSTDYRNLGMDSKFT